jgi:hypothetical protein
MQSHRMMKCHQTRWCFLVLVLVPLAILILVSPVGAGAALAPQESSGKFDGPAELPRVYLHTALADTPATGHVRSVRAGENLQEALDSAKCGDTLELQAGATFRGFLKIPAKSCDDAHWIIVRTSAPDSALPPEGARLTPCYGGVASLPGRPDFRCASTNNVLARISYDGNSGGGPFNIQPGANHYRFIGLELTRGGQGASIGALIFMRDQAGGANHLILDRMWLHGTAQEETTRGIALSGMTYVAIQDSYFSDFHCIAMTGSCTDAQAISGGGGDQPGGPYKIVNNFLEASGENILFGGGAATTTPTDIEIRRNHLFKPMIWKPGEPGQVVGASGRPFIVKNHFELKNGQRVLFEGNLLENVWGGFSQSGFSILLTPKSQNNRCPTCRVTDVTIRYNLIRNVGSVFQLANVPADAGGSATAGERYSIHDLLVENVHEKDYQGFGLFAMVLSNSPPLRDVRIDHVTAFVPKAIISIFNRNEQKISGFTLTNNVLGSGQERQIGTAGGGPDNCAYQPDKQGPAGVLKSCFEKPTITHNMIVGGTTWPSGNLTPKDAHAAGIRESREGGGFRLCRQKQDGCQKSPGAGSASDGKDMGADLDAIEKAIAGAA